MLLCFASLLYFSHESDLDRVLVVANSASKVSVSIAEYYRVKRGVQNRVEITCPDSSTGAGAESIDYSAYVDKIEKPIKAYLASHPKIDFIVLTKGVPIRLLNAPGIGLANKQPSLDSTLASVDYQARPGCVTISISDSGFVGTCYVNNFWNAKGRFSHSKYGGYLVTRLDGYTEADAKALVDSSLSAEKGKPSGAFLIDVCPAKGDADITIQPRGPLGPPDKGGKPTLGDVGYNDFNADMKKAAEKLAGRALKYEMDETDTFIGSRRGLIGYVSWGSNDNKFDANAYKSLQFAPGAVAETAVSTSGRTFLPTSGGQSLIADLIAQGVTGVKGYTDEPLLTAVASPSILFERYTRGWTLAESFYAASRLIGWEDVVIGDPICCPYRQ